MSLSSSLIFQPSFQDSIIDCFFGVFSTFIMEPSNYNNITEKPRYIDFPALEHGVVVDGKQALNRWSSRITKGHDFPGAQVRKCYPNEETKR